MASVFEPSSIKVLLANTLPNKTHRQKFSEGWDKEVVDNVNRWTAARQGHAKQEKQSPTDPSSSPSMLAQFKFIAHVAQYVKYITQLLGTPKRPGHDSLPDGVPLLGPRFLPPTPHLLSKHRKIPLTPDAYYVRPVTIIHPVFYPFSIRCPTCRRASDTSESLHDPTNNDKLAPERWNTDGPRRVHGIDDEEFALGLQLKCKLCETHRNTMKETSAKGSGCGPGVSGKKTSIVFNLTSVEYWEGIPYWEIPDGIPLFMSKSAITQELFHDIVENRVHTTALGLHKIYYQKHTLKYHLTHRAYLQAKTAEMDLISAPGHEGRTKTIQTTLNLMSGSTHLGFNDPTEQYRTFKPFSGINDSNGYNNSVISNVSISTIYELYAQNSRLRESSWMTRSILGDVLSIDHTMRTAAKAVVIDKSHQRIKPFSAVFQVLDEESRILAWRFCQSGSFQEIKEVLIGLRSRYHTAGKEGPSMVVSDNCCAVRNVVTEVFPNTHVALDVWHFMMRYLTTILDGSRNPHYVDVRKDIISSILSKTADSTKSQVSSYWPRHLQVKAIQEMYMKWLSRSSVWTQASAKIHEAQLEHVRKGCLTRTKAGVKADGSRIERSHVAWNGLQRGCTSGIVAMNALGHDHVLRWNMARMSSAVQSTAPGSPSFIQSCSGSSHVGLVNSNAHTWNRLLERNPSNHHHPLPCLEPYETEETFGIVQSDHACTTLPITIKQEDSDMLAEGDREQLGLDPYPPTDKFIQHAMIEDPAMHMDANMFIQPLTHVPSLPPPPSTSEGAYMFSSQSTTTGAGLNSDDDAVFQTFDDDVFTTNLQQIPSQSSTTSPCPESRTLITPQKRKGTELEGSQQLERKRLHLSLGPTSSTMSPEVPIPKMTSTQPEDPPLTASQRFLEAQTNLSSSLFSIKKGEKDWFTFVKLRNEHQWIYSTLIGTALQSATNILNNQISTPKMSHAIRQCLKDLELEVIRRISSEDYSTIDPKTKEKRFSPWWKGTCEAVPGLVPLGKHCHRCRKTKTGKSRVSHPRTTCSDGFLSTHKEVPYPLPGGLTISNGGPKVIGALLPEAFATVVTRTMIKSSNNQDLTPEEHCLLEWIYSNIFTHNDGEAKWSIFPIGKIPIAGGDADCQRFIMLNGHRHLRIFKTA